MPSNTSVSDSALQNLLYYQIQCCWIWNWASLRAYKASLQSNTDFKCALEGSSGASYAQQHLSVRFGAAESDTQHHCMHIRPQCQIQQCQICSTADLVALNLTLRHGWAHETSLLPFDTNWQLVLNCSEALCPCSHSQCQIWQRWICCTPDLALPNLTLGMTACIEGITTIQYQLLIGIERW